MVTWPTVKMRRTTAWKRKDASRILLQEESVEPEWRQQQYRRDGRGGEEKEKRKTEKEEKRKKEKRKRKPEWKRGKRKEEKVKRKRAPEWKQQQYRRDGRGGGRRSREQCF